MSDAVAVLTLLGLVLLAGAAGGLGFGVILAHKVNAVLKERFEHWEAEVDRITAQEADAVPLRQNVPSEDGAA